MTNVAVILVMPHWLAVKCCITLITSNVVSNVYRRFHGDVIRRVTWASGTTGWQKTFGWRAPRVFLLVFMPCLH